MVAVKIIAIIAFLLATIRLISLLGQINKKRQGLKKRERIERMTQGDRSYKSISKWVEKQIPEQIEGQGGTPRELSLVMVMLIALIVVLDGAVFVLMLSLL